MHTIYLGDVVFQAALELRSKKEWIFHNNVKASMDSYLDNEPSYALRFNRDEQYEPRVYPRMGCLKIRRTETITYIPTTTTTTTTTILRIQSHSRRTRKVKILLKIITRKTTNHGNHQHQHRRRERETKTITITILSFRVDE